MTWKFLLTKNFQFKTIFNLNFSAVFFRSNLHILKRLDHQHYQWMNDNIEVLMAKFYEILQENIFI